ncbi:conserved hypothetical protein [Chelatococcus asaccharovorans]|uniref:Uncharacterized protein n=1 Tax=Chelatococcus asaccharovorans TaxID=28210 RepID=A0A2V3U1R1_9HYPH|nr:hypothetical protein [Chelatococcus asaccharovorans]MBS7702447.1 hypothetical protein [Chelatococcus asaccharovorans]PXW56345.1 hypothetical protein C7450_10894 [Chelatococcus asaccharovorans]CAH1670574.1 conserved hypothetical protein [Chelatococcus asaccharovorans]CAH1677976.1 conserved hypothetical protein [Chelatococcus asaccharovorans]
MSAAGHGHRRQHVNKILRVQRYLILHVTVLNMHSLIDLPVLLKKAGLRQATATR